MQHINRKTVKSYFYRNKGWFMALMLSDLFEALGLVVVSYFIACVFEAIGTTDMNAVFGLLPMGAFALIFFFGSNLLQSFTRRKFLRKIDTQIRTDVFSNVIAQDYKKFGEKNAGEYISVLNNDLEKIEDEYLIKMPYMLETSIMSIVASVFLFVYSKEMAFVIIFSAIFLIAIPVCFGNYVSNKNSCFMDGLSRYNVRIKDIFSGFEVIKSFNAEKQINNVHTKILNDMEEQKYHYRVANNMFYNVIQVSTYLVIVLQYIAGAYLITKGHVTLAAAMGALNLGNTVNNQFREAMSAIVAVRGTKGIQEKINKMLEIEDGKRTESVFDKNLGDIRIENLSFSYDDSSKVLEDVNFRFEQGKKYAIVGGSGSGKSTLVKLLMQYYDNYKGTIYCDMENITSVDRATLYSKMAMIHQKVFLFDDTIKNNITMFQEYDSATLQDVIQKSGLHRIVEERGLDYQLGDGGNKLSGGEQQRIAIARALLKRTNVLILDEATASLDNQVGTQIENTVLEQDNLTAIVVTHKLSETLLKKYDCIVVMHKGRIVECGNFEELLERKDMFYSLFMLR